MILFCDEDIGTKVPQALELVGLPTFSLVKRGWISKPDVEWLTEAGKRSWLALSCNKKMLLVPQERETIIRERVGIVFLTSGEENLPKTLKLLLTKWTWLESIHLIIPRPFAFLLYPNGHTRQRLSQSSFLV